VSGTVGAPKDARDLRLRRGKSLYEKGRIGETLKQLEDDRRTDMWYIPTSKRDHQLLLDPHKKRGKKKNDSGNQEKYQTWKARLSSRWVSQPTVKSEM